MTLPNGAARLLAQQQAVIRQTAAAAIKGNAEALHDLRAAFRRVRCYLRNFREQLPGAMKLSNSFGRLNHELGPSRDLDVWIALLKRLGRKPKFASLRDWKDFVRQQLARRQRQLPRVSRTLRSAQFASASQVLQALEQEIGKSTELKSRANFTRFAARQLRRLLRRIRANDAWRRDHRPPIIHAARKRFRRVRYLAEAFAPALGADVYALARQLHEVEQRLGRAHDMDRASALFEKVRSPIKPLACEVRRRRKKSLARAEAALKRIRWRKAEMKLKRYLDA